MLNSIEHILIVLSFLLLASVLLSKISAKTGMPTSIIFLGIGMLAGSDGIGGFGFDNYFIAQNFGNITIALILFYGGLDTDIRRLKGAILKAISMSTIGVFVTSILVGFFISFFTKFNFVEGVLIGAIISPTDAAAIFATLKSRKTKLKYKLAEILELESGTNDIISFSLMMVCIKILSQGESWSLNHEIIVFLKEMAIGGGIGFVLGKSLVFIINRVNLMDESLYPGIPLAGVLFGYSITTYLHGSGFLCVYMAALIMGSHNLLHKESLKKFFEVLMWLMEIVMFLLLGLLVFPKNFISIYNDGVVVALIVTLLARPVGVFIALLFSKEADSKQKIFLSWGGLRGAASIIFAIYPILNSINGSYDIFNIIFFVVILSSLTQGTTFTLVAKALKLVAKDAIINNIKIDNEIIQKEMTNIIVPNNFALSGTKLLNLGLPQGTSIISIEREGIFITPHGKTKIFSMDKLQIALAEKEHLGKLKKIFEKVK